MNFVRILNFYSINQLLLEFEKLICITGTVETEQFRLICITGTVETEQFRLICITGTVETEKFRLICITLYVIVYFMT